MTMQNKRLTGIVLAVPFILLIPLIGNAPWTLFDFVVMGLLLLCTGLAMEFVMKKVKKIEHRIILCGVVLFVCFLMWAELSVGIFRTPFAGS
ncbi:MAG: hypothetical protein AVDCRST_MAG96-3966 [uncultured Segetibacter sp.]|uniref:Uncharacterized protein n=1 Tax=uncultured Segetibacter sp. TaxID=481133 RepID=A0A6J4TZX9_9BACT|nr:MAG: hypothetical protein AVDCRST_MAG96-3966 [uncultured Segetibacter sp.]